jgi:cytochrome c oxidase subunit IV
MARHAAPDPEPAPRVRRADDSEATSAVADLHVMLHNRRLLGLSILTALLTGCGYAIVLMALGRLHDWLLFVVFPAIVVGCTVGAMLDGVYKRAAAHRAVVVEPVVVEPVVVEPVVVEPAVAPTPIADVVELRFQDEEFADIDLELAGSELDSEDLDLADHVDVTEHDTDPIPVVASVSVMTRDPTPTPPTPRTRRAAPPSPPTGLSRAIGRGLGDVRAWLDRGRR